MKREEWKRIQFMRRSGSIFQNHRRRAKDAGMAMEFTLEDVRQLATAAIENPCVYCGLPITVRNFSIDHVQPLQRAGQHTLSNIECTCDRCNQIKGNMTKAEFLVVLAAANQLDEVAKASMLARMRAGSRFIYN